MPITGGTPKKKSGGGSLLNRINSRVRKIEHDFVRGGEASARGLPTQVFAQAKATGALFQGDPRPMGRILHDQAIGTKTTVEHPLRDPFQTTMLALALASAGGGSVARLGAGARATGGVGARLRAAARRPEYVRVQERMPGKPGQHIAPHVLNASPNPLLRLARKVTLDPIYKTSLKEGKKAQSAAFKTDVAPLRVEVKKTQREINNIQKARDRIHAKQTAEANREIAALKKQRADLIERGHSASGIGIQQSINPKITAARLKLREGKKEANLEMNTALKEARTKIREQRRAVLAAEKVASQGKAGRYARHIEKKTTDQQTRYAKQGQLAQEDVEVPTGAVTGNNIFNTLYNLPVNALRASMFIRPRYIAQNVGSTGMMLGAQQPLGMFRSAKRTASLRKHDRETYEQSKNTMGATATTSTSEGAVGKGSGLVRWLGEKANKPEAAIRVMALEYEARMAGLSLRELHELPDSSQKKQRIMARANEALGDYGRLGNAERSVMKSGIPIFYPMYKALARYTAGLPNQHSILTALASSQGAEGYKQQMEDFGGALPPWEPYPTLVGKNKTINAQNVLPYSPGTDLWRMATAGMDQPTQTLAALAGPNIEFGYGAITGRNIGSGFRLPGLKEDSSAQQKLLAALKELATTAPGRDYIAATGVIDPLSGASYEDPTKFEQAMNILLGPAFYPRRRKLKVLKKQSKRYKKKD